MTIPIPAVAAFLWTLSLFLALGLSPFHEIERMAAVLVCLGAAGLLVLRGGHLDRRPVIAPGIAFAVLLLWLLVTISAAWSVAPPLSLLYSGTFAALPATLLAIAFAPEEERGQFLRAAAWMAGTIVAGLSLWALLQVFVFPEFLVRGQVRHPFANPNAFAALLNLALFAGLGLLLRDPGKKTRLALMAGLFLTGAAVAAIASQAATLTLAASLIIALIMARRSIGVPQIKTLSGIAIAVLAMGFVMAMMPEKTEKA